jgi:diguanylate cyclase (GGDEF)-like protein/PAS domain S-box-containing protein
MSVQAFKTLRAAGSSGAYFRRSVLLRLLAFVALCLPVLWLGVGAELRQLDEIAQRESHRDVANMARAFSEEINATVSTIDLSLLHLRSHWEPGGAGFGERVRRLNRELHGRVILQIAVTDTRGIVVFSSLGSDRRADLSDREHIRFQLDGQGDELFVSRPLFGRMSKVWAVQFTRPIRDAGGRLLGVILASVEPSYFTRFYASIDLGPGTSTSLVRRDGTVLARATNGALDRTMGTMMSGYPYQRQSRAVPDGPSEGVFRRAGRLDGIERNYAWRDLPDYPLMVTVGQSIADVDARFARQKSMLLRGGAAASVLLALLAWVVLAAADTRRRGAAALRAAEARWKLALNASGEGVWDCDLVSGMATLSPRAQAIFEAPGPTMACTREALPGIVHPEDMPRLKQALKDHYEGRSPDFAAEHRIARRDGQWRWILVRGMVAERDENGKPLRMVGTFADIDTRKHQEERMRHQASHDALTGLPNRALFADRLRQAIRVAKREHVRLAVLYFDLDRFKPVNDTFGHAVGDALLVAMARRVEARLRDSDTLARMGGDEFVVLLPRCAGPEDARKVGENILAQLNREFVIEGHTVRISGSIGYALFPDDSRDSEELVRRADHAMYEAKANGRGQVCGYVEKVADPA